MSKKRTVKISLDAKNLPPLSAKQKQALVELGKLPESEIDYSDIPAMTPEEEPMYKPVKKLTTVRIDADVLAWLKTYGKGYQTKINAILRQEMLLAKGK
jgi:Uncharacterized protein conserved in bacteria